MHKVSKKAYTCYDQNESKGKKKQRTNNCISVKDVGIHLVFIITTKHILKGKQSAKIMSLISMALALSTESRCWSNMCM